MKVSSDDLVYSLLYQIRINIKINCDNIFLLIHQSVRVKPIKDIKEKCNSFISTQQLSFD